MQIDHITSVAMGGDDDKANLLLSCQECNSGKGAKQIGNPTANEDLEEEKQRVWDRVNILQDICDGHAHIIEAREKSMWLLIERWQDARCEGPPKGKKRETSQYFAAIIRGLLARCTFEEVLDCIDITLARMSSSKTDAAVRYLYAVVKNRASLIDDVEAVK